MRQVRQIVKAEVPPLRPTVDGLGREVMTKDPTVVTLSCGHTYLGNPVFKYPIGDWTTCSDCPEIPLLPDPEVAR